MADRGGFAAGAFEGAVGLGLGGVAEEAVDRIGRETVETFGHVVGESVDPGGTPGDREGVHVEGAVTDESAKAILPIVLDGDVPEKIVVVSGIDPGEDGAAERHPENLGLEPLEQIVEGDGGGDSLQGAGFGLCLAVDFLGTGFPGVPPFVTDGALEVTVGSIGVERHGTDLEDAAGDGIEAAGFEVEDDDTVER